MEIKSIRKIEETDKDNMISHLDYNMNTKDGMSNKPDESYFSSSINYPSASDLEL